MKRPPDDEILGGVPADGEEEEEPTRTLEMPRHREVPQARKAARPRRSPPRERPPETPPEGRGEMSSIGSLVESEEALRVFDEMSKPDGAMSTYPGADADPSPRRVARDTRPSAPPRVRPPTPPEEESRIQTLPPYPAGATAARQTEPPGESATMEVSFSEIVEVGEPAASPPPGGPERSDGTVDPAIQWEAWSVFEHCPCPLFRLDGSGKIQLANLALGQFLGAAREDLIGVALHRTRLGRIVSDLEEELDGCLATRSALQRVVSYQASAEQSVSFLLWIVPFPRRAGRSNAVSGIILPYPG